MKFWLMDKPSERSREEADIEKLMKEYEELFGERVTYCVVEGGSMEEAIEELKNCLRTKTKRKKPTYDNGVTY